jgi:hypothetical protein
MAGVSVATITTLLVVPSIYALVARFTGSPATRARVLDEQLATGTGRPGGDTQSAA